MLLGLVRGGSVDAADDVPVNVMAVSLCEVLGEVVEPDGIEVVEAFGTKVLVLLTAVAVDELSTVEE